MVKEASNNADTIIWQPELKTTGHISDTLCRVVLQGPVLNKCPRLFFGKPMMAYNTFALPSPARASHTLFKLLGLVDGYAGA